jgi:hypothetical protein
MFGLAPGFRAHLLVVLQPMLVPTEQAWLASFVAVALHDVVLQKRLLRDLAPVEQQPCNSLLPCRVWICTEIERWRRESGSATVGIQNLLN